MNSLFPETYESSRERFRANLGRIQSRWQSARLEAHRYAGDEDVTTDWIRTDNGGRDKLVIFTTGEHGVEGYVGSTMLEMFIQDYLPRLDVATTDVLLIHAINPWGMKHKRRVNANNVDLNRNFLYDAQPDPGFNPEYAQLVSLLMPQGRLSHWRWSRFAFLARLLWQQRSLGASKVRHIILLGQYAHPRGLFYGGDAIQDETRVTMNLYREAFAQSARIVHFDMHSGYGPRYQMQLVNSWMERRDPRMCMAQFNFPLVSATTPSSFYQIRGDMIDYVYTLAQNEFPSKRFYSTTFEFGTIGDSTWNAMESLRIKVLENQKKWYGANEGIRKHIAREFGELYCPSEERWREKAIADARQAFDGILRTEEFIQ